MVQSVELLLDEVTESAVREQWEALATAGLPSQSHHTGATNRPHVTVDARDSLDVAAEAALPEAARMLPLDVTVGACTVFGRTSSRSGLILVRLVVVDEALLRLHRAVHEATGPGGAPTAAPGRWVPHVTLARRLDPDGLAHALQVLDGVLDGAPDLVGRATVLRRWDGEAKRAWDVEA